MRTCSMPSGFVTTQMGASKKVEDESIAVRVLALAQMSEPLATHFEHVFHEKLAARARWA